MLSEQIFAQSTTKTYLDLSIDQMVIGGLTDNQVRTYETQGYKLTKTKKDFEVIVQFKKPDGVIYSKTGWLQTGTVVLYKVVEGNKAIIVCRPCGNPGETMEDQGYLE